MHTTGKTNYLVVTVIDIHVGKCRVETGVDS